MGAKAWLYVRLAAGVLTCSLAQADTPWNWFLHTQPESGAIEDEAGGAEEIRVLCPPVDPSTGFLMISSEIQGERCLKDIIKKITQDKASRFPDQYPNGDLRSAHWLAPYRSAKTLDVVQRAQFVQDMDLLSDGEKTFLAMTMAAYAQAGSVHGERNCIALGESSTPEARRECLEDESSLSMMQEKLGKALEAGATPADVYKALVNGPGSYFHSNMKKMPEMIRGMALAIETPDTELGKNVQTLGFQRALRAYSLAMNDLRKPVALLQLQPAVKEDVEQGDGEHGTTLSGGTSNHKGFSLQGFVKKTGKVVADVVVAPYKETVRAMKALWPDREKVLETDESRDELMERLVNRVVKTREKIREALNASDNPAHKELWKRIVNACPGALSGEDHRALMAFLTKSNQLSQKTARALGQSSRDVLSFKPEKELGYYSESDLFALTATAASEASGPTDPRDWERKHPGELDRNPYNTRIRTEMLATMMVMRSRAEYDYRNSISSPKIVTAALNKGGGAFQGWSPGVHTGCLIAGPLNEGRAKRGPLGGGDDDLTLKRSVAAFMDLVNPNTKIIGNSVSPKIHYFAVGYDPSLHSDRVYPTFEFEDHPGVHYTALFHIFANRNRRTR